MSQTHKHMTFKDAFELELAQRLATNEDGDAIVRWAGEKLLESYKNGIEVGRKGGTVIRKGKSRARPFPSSQAR
jgi:hypothetical protein